MGSIAYITNTEGEKIGLNLRLEDNPEIIPEMYELLRVILKVKETERAKVHKKVSKKAMTFDAVLDLIDESKMSGELTAAQFSELHPTWQKNERLSSLS
ncbi:MAG: hypothetical protein AAFS00_07370 [Bacteroidota bacterium]